MEGKTGLWPMANELFSAGSAARRERPAACSICMFMLHKDKGTAIRERTFLGPNKHI